MNFSFKEFFKSTPLYVDIAIAFVLISFGLGFGLAIGNSHKVEFGKSGLRIQRQAIATQKDLEWALTIIKIQDGLITRQEQEARDFSRRYEAGQELLETASFAADVIPKQQINELESRVEESKLLFHETLPN